VCKHGVQQATLLETLLSIKDGLTSQNDLLANMRRLAVVFQEAQDAIRHATILRALKPSVIYEREEEIKEHHPTTFNWIIEQHGTRLVEWLTEGSGVYHIAGKPGSGKSTLMKFLVGESVVRTYLEQWAACTNTQLIISKFFFWKYGSDDQKSVRGLLRGLLYDMSKDNIEIAKSLFPRFWGDVNDWRLPAASEAIIKGSDIRAAFNQLRTDEELRGRFRLCLFIDGLDEFDGKEMSYSRLAKELQAWAEGSDSASFLKICVSSREEHPIMSVFPARQRIHLQDFTGSDITAMVNDMLETNESFAQLIREDEDASRKLVASIVKDAEGVFLWVVLLLKLFEDELSSGVSSVASLQNIVRSTPKELEEFLGQIIDSIHNHHKHGAYFILAMALRMIGFHLTEEGSFDEVDKATYINNFKFSRGFAFSWRPHLPLYGIGKVLDEFERNNTQVDSWARSKWVSDEEYRAESRKAAGRIRSWCRGLLDVPDTHALDHIALQDLDLRFAHRSIPDFLASAIPIKACDFNFGDDDTARAILAVAIAQTRSAPGLREVHSGYRHVAGTFQHILYLLRLRKIPESSGIPQMLDELDVARFETHGRSCKQLLQEDESMAPPLSEPLPIQRGDQQLLILPLKWSTRIEITAQIARANNLGEPETFGEAPAGIFSTFSTVLTHVSPALASIPVSFHHRCGANVLLSRHDFSF
jgi:hypothetical protein